MKCYIGDSITDSLLILLIDTITVLEKILPSIEIILIKKSYFINTKTNLNFMF